MKGATKPAISMGLTCSTQAQAMEKQKIIGSMQWSQLTSTGSIDVDVQVPVVRSIELRCRRHMNSSAICSLADGPTESVQASSRQ